MDFDAAVRAESCRRSSATTLRQRGRAGTIARSPSADQFAAGVDAADQIGSRFLEQAPLAFIVLHRRDQFVEGRAKRRAQIAVFVGKALVARQR